MKEMFNYFVYILVCFICYFFVYCNYYDMGLFKNEFVLFDILRDINVLLFNK